MKRMKKISLIEIQIYGTCFLIFILFGILPVLIKSGSFNNNNNNKADGFTIEGYNVILDVHEDNKINVTENITVDWYNTNHHGIYKFTPQWLEYTNKNGKTLKRKAIINYLKSDSDPYSVDWVKKKARIKLGSAYEYVSYGPKIYSISYEYDMGKDPYHGFDEFIFHAYGDYWGTDIKNASLEIRMPKSISDAQINFFTDKYRNNNVTSYVDYQIKNNTIYAKFNAKEYGKQLENSLTVDIELPEDYFVGGSFNYGYKSLITIIIIAILTMIIIFTWFKYGKDLPKKAQTIEFYPPENLSAAEIGYIYHKCSGKKLTIASIIQLASKRYIKIDEDEKAKDIKITNLCQKPDDLPDIEKVLPTRTIVVKKLKAADINLDKKSSTMMQFLFSKVDEKTLQTNIDKFEEVADSLINGGYVEIISDNKEEIDEKRANLEYQIKDQKEQYDKDMKNYEEKKNRLQPLSIYEQEVYDKLFTNIEIEVSVKNHSYLYQAFDNVDSMLDENLKDLVSDKTARKKMKMSFIMTAITAVLSFISYSIFEDLDPVISYLYTLSFVCVFANLFFSIFMKRKTNYGEELMAKIKGFKEFLVSAKKEELEAMVNKHPNYYYDILPYTYVLNISKIWISKFEDIPIPEVDMGNFNYADDSCYSSISDNVHYPQPVSTSSGGGGCSSCGGGCSSCGGGCSSCGGGGSW